MLALILDLVLSFGVSLAVIAYLRPMLRDALRLRCENGGRSVDFWLRLTDLLMLLAPLAEVILFGPRIGESLDSHLRRVLFITLCGNVLGLAWTGRTIWKHLVAPQRQQAVEPSAQG
ncbi:hypothetical protein [Chitinimonas lacunae]|uniref:Uncharacterized protein n=1 Tax=Chitinimonas lacunae TaxID=1963018 RepID=A0ABV8MNR6_9NEIS